MLNGGKNIASETTAPRELINDAPIQTSSNDMRAPSASQSATSTSQNGGASSSARAHRVDQSETSTIQNGSAHASMDAYVQGLFSQLTRGQSQARNGIASESFTGNSVVSDNGQSLLGATPASNVNSAPQTQSWKDPQIYLSSAANGKSASLHYDIVDFVSGHVEEEIIVGGSGSHQVVLKSGPKKPKLENVSLAQWTIANLAILYKLNGEAKLTGDGILDYLSYTTKVCQLVQRYNLVSVLLYDSVLMSSDGEQMYRTYILFICNPVCPAQEILPKREVTPC